MTQRKWTTTDGWEVLTGWDRPLQHFFVNIDRECIACQGAGERPEVGEEECKTCEGSGTEYLFNNLSDTKFTDPMGGMTIVQVQQVLELKLTQHPQSLVADLMLDKRNNVGNFSQQYGVLGEAKETGGE